MAEESSSDQIQEISELARALRSAVETMDPATLRRAAAAQRQQAQGDVIICVTGCAPR